MSNDNHLMIEGNLTRDPELRFSNAGLAFASLGFAHTPRKRDHNGQWVDGDTIWLDITCFGQVAENVAESFSKGDRVVAIGSLTLDSWEDKETGDKRSKHKMLADMVCASTRFSVVTSRRADRTAERPQDRSATHPQPTPPVYADEEPF